MSTEFTMPKLGHLMEEGTVANWKIDEGSSITKGEIIVEIETDKSVLGVESPFTGTVKKILVAEGETVRVNSPLAIIEL